MNVPIGAIEQWAEVTAGVSAWFEAVGLVFSVSYVGPALLLSLTVTVGLFLWRMISGAVK